MTSRSQKIILVFLVIVLLIIATGVVAQIILRAVDNELSGNIEIRDTPDPLAAKLTNMISRYKKGELDAIDLSVVTTFSWDRLYMFGDYTSASEIDAVVGRSWRKNCYTQIGLSDGYTLLVFIENNTVFHCLDYPKDEGNFLIPEQAYHEGLSSQEFSLHSE